MKPVDILRSLGGAARASQLKARGLTPFLIEKSLARGDVLRASRGVYALAHAHPEVVRAVQLGAAFTCISALARHGLPVPRTPLAPHLAVARNFHAAAHELGGARLHYQSRRPEPGATAEVAAALDAAGDCLDEEWHLAAVDAALNRGVILLGDVAGFTRTSRERREFLLAFADARAEAPGETIARVRLARAGFSVRPQAYVEGAGRVDLEVDGLLILQVDGYEPHSSKRAFVRDRRGSRAVIRAGRPQLSYAASELLGEYSPDLVGEVRDALNSWRARDLGAIRPSGQRVLRISRD